MKKNDGGEVMRKNSRRNMAAGTVEKIADYRQQYERYKMQQPVVKVHGQVCSV